MTNETNEQTNIVIREIADAVVNQGITLEQANQYFEAATAVAQIARKNVKTFSAALETAKIDLAREELRLEHASLVLRVVLSVNNVKVAEA